MIDEAIKQPPVHMIPDSFTNDLVKRLEKHLAWKELISEFGMKLGIVALSVIILLLFLIFPARNDPAPWIDWILKHSSGVALVAGVLFFTFIFDQVFLKFMVRKSKHPF